MDQKDRTSKDNIDKHIQSLNIAYDTSADKQFENKLNFYNVPILSQDVLLMQNNIRLSGHRQNEYQKDIQTHLLEDDGIPDEFKHFTSNLGTN